MELKNSKVFAMADGGKSERPMEKNTSNNSILSSTVKDAMEWEAKREVRQLDQSTTVNMTNEMFNDTPFKTVKSCVYCNEGCSKRVLG